MNRKTRNLLILLVMLAVLTVGLVLVLVLGGGEGEENATTDGTETVIMRVDTANLSKLVFTYDRPGAGETEGDGIAEMWTYTLNEEGVWLWNTDKSIPLSASAFETMVAALEEVTAQKTLINVSAESLAAYGFDRPSKAIRVTDSLYGEQAIYFGAYNAYNEMYYVTLNNDRSTVYMVDSSLYDIFEYPVEALISFDDLPEISDPARLVSLTYESSARTVVCAPTIVAAETADGADPSISMIWDVVTNGGESVRLDDATADKLTELICAMDYLTCYSVRADEMAEYGLEGDDAATMTLVYLDAADEEHTFTLSLGDLNDYGYYYANPSDTTMTMMLGGAVFAEVFGDVQPSEIVTETAAE